MTAPKEPSTEPGESIERDIASAKARGWIGYEERMAFEIRLKQCAIDSLRAAAARHSAEVVDLREKLAEREAEVTALKAQLAGRGGSVPYLDRLREIAARHESAVAERDAALKRIEELEAAIMPEHDLGISFEACCGRERSHTAALIIQTARKEGKS